MSPLGYQQMNEPEPDARTVTITVQFPDGFTATVPVTESILRQDPGAPILVALETHDAA
jgi:hypothetical protein